MKTVLPIFIVGIGGSAGALNAYKALLDALPSGTGMAFVIISGSTTNLMENTTLRYKLALISFRTY